MRKSNLFFLGSILFGLFIWFFFFIITPINIKNSLSFEIRSFIILCYLALVLGYLAPSRVMSSKIINNIQNYEKNVKQNTTLLLKILISLVLFSFVIRYYDLFFNRDLNLLDYRQINKLKASDSKNFSLTYGMLAGFRLIYFVPLIFYFNNKVKQRTIFVFCIFLFILPLFEAYMRDSRRIIFESFGLLLLILVLFNKIRLKSFSTYIYAFSIALGFLFFSFSVVKERVNTDSETFYKRIFSSPYNDFVPPKNKAVNFINKDKNNFFVKVYFLEIHVGQYITHGIYEMDYTTSKLSEYKYGMFNSYLLVKLLNKLKITDYPLAELNNPSKRNTYLTFFGGLYIDFGWFSLIFMFLFGWLQKKIFLLNKYTSVFKPIIVLLLFSNVFLLIFNFIRAQFILTIFVYIVLVIMLSIVFRIIPRWNILIKK